MGNCGVSHQLTNILDQFMRENWDDVNGKRVNTKVISENKKPVPQPQQSKSPSAKELKKDPNVQMLCDMGFDAELCYRALQMHNQSVEAAANALLTDPESVLLFNEEKLEDDDFIQPKKGSEKDPKLVPPRQFGILVQIMEYVRNRLTTLPDYCVICDHDHVYGKGTFLKPAVCIRPLCVFAFQSLGVMADAADDLATGAEVVDLLICMAIAAANSDRRDQIFDPYPTVVDPDNPKLMALSADRKDFNLVRTILNCFPNASNSKNRQEKINQQDIVTRHRLAWPLLTWIISSNRSHIVKIPKDKRIKTMGTPFQYLLLSAPPEKEEKFKKLRTKYGSKFAFHGSRVENWHSILRNGLKNASGTKLQLNGAAYGNGIYLALDASISFGYSSLVGGNNSNKEDENTPLTADQFFLYCNL